MSHYVSNISAKEEKKGNNTRLSCPFSHEKWQKRAKKTPCKGPQAVVYCLGHKSLIMLARKNRIPTKEFPSFKDKGIRFVSGLFSGTLYKTTAKTQISVVVSKKTAKTAVARNLLRRRFYSTISPLVKRISKGTRLVFYPNTEAIKAPFPTIRAEIEEVFQKNKIIS